MENSLHYTSVNHAYHLVDSINQLRKKEELCDVILNCGDTQIPAHKLILSVSTPYFKNLVDNQRKDTTKQELQVEGLDSQAVRNIIEFFYTSAVSVDDVTVWTLLPAACLLQVEEIQNLCCDFLSSQLQADNCLRINRVAAKCLCSGLLKESTEYIIKNFSQLLEEEEVFLDLSIRDLIGHLKRLGEMGLTNENILQVLKCWVICSVDDRQMLGYKLLQEFPDLKDELENFIPVEYQVQQDDVIVQETEEEFSRPSPQPCITMVTSKMDATNTADSSLHNGKLNPLMCFECSEVFENTEDLKKHVQVHLNTLLGRNVDSPAQREKSESPFDVSAYNKILGGDVNSNASNEDSNAEGSYFDTYIKARGLDNLSLGGLKRERDSSKGTSAQKQITITVTGTSGDGQELKFICPICGKTCPSPDELGKHIEAHSGFSCTICGRSYSTKGNLQTHMKKHNAEPSIVCTYCDKTFTNASLLKVHIRSHTGEKPFECETCGVTFSKNIHLKRHLAIHTGIKPHECEVCKKRFSRSDHLKRHIQSIHTQNRPHICSLCGKDFVRKYELNKHMKQMHWGFTVGQNGVESSENSFTHDSMEQDTIVDSPANQNMHKLKGAFIMGDNNNGVGEECTESSNVENEAQVQNIAQEKQEPGVSNLMIKQEPYM